MKIIFIEFIAHGGGGTLYSQSTLSVYVYTLSLHFHSILSIYTLSIYSQFILASLVSKSILSVYTPSLYSQSILSAYTLINPRGSQTVSRCKVNNTNDRESKILRAVTETLV